MVKKRVFFAKINNPSSGVDIFFVFAWFYQNYLLDSIRKYILLVYLIKNTRDISVKMAFCTIETK